MSWFDRLLNRDSSRQASFEQCADDAIHELYPELFWGDPSSQQIIVCRVCGGNGFHNDGCALIKPENRDKATVDDLLKAAGDADIKRVSTDELYSEEVPKVKVEAKDANSPNNG